MARDHGAMGATSAATRRSRAERSCLPRSLYVRLRALQMARWSAGALSVQRRRFGEARSGMEARIPRSAASVTTFVEW